MNTRTPNSEKMNKFHSDNRTSESRDSNNRWLNSDRSKLLIAQPDRFYINFIYDALEDHLYHMDIDTVVINKNRQIIALIESIKGLDNLISKFKREIYTQIARALGVPFYIVNWDRYKNKAIVRDGLTNSVQVQTLFEHKRWLRSLRESHQPRRVRA